MPIQAIGAMCPPPHNGAEKKNECTYTGAKLSKILILDS